MEKWFEIINLSAGKEKGLLKMVGNRDVVVSVKILPGSNNADTDWLMENMRNLYLQYYSRVAAYRNVEGV